ncbi:hypothetical protein [Rummeliibacillus pycnus]|uniref:hypothetical protein n=1 Tax=Rummeliibacillus pycnus TaxID=101070 RepID=UPI0037C76DD2
MFYFISMYRARELEFLDTVKILGGFLLGVLLLWMTIPSLKSVLMKDYDVVSGKCTVEITSSGRSTDSTFNMLDTDEQFEFQEIPDLNAYGRSIPYYCEVTVTKDHMFGIDYKIYDFKTRKLVNPSD